MIFASLSTVMCLPEPEADLDLLRRATRFLQDRQPSLLGRVQLAAELGIVTVRGVVRSFYERQLVVACIRRVAGVRQVVDLLVVMDEARPLTSRRAASLEVLP